MSRPIRMILVVISVYLGLVLLVFLFQERLVYLPGPEPSVSPADWGLTYQDLELATDDGERIHAWFVPAEEGAAALVYCHGNAGNLSHRRDAIQAFRAMGLSVLIFDYRGYGRSSGSPDEDGTYADARAALAWLTNEAALPRERILFYGESLGGGVATQLATEHAPAGLILESAFTSTADMGARLYPWLPVRMLTRNRYENAAKLPTVAAPVLVIHSPDDEIVPFTQGRELFELAAEPKRFLETGAGHNGGGFVRSATWRAQVREFVESCLSR